MAARLAEEGEVNQSETLDRFVREERFEQVTYMLEGCLGQFEEKGLKRSGRWALSVR